jgi:hypothetical protein
VWSLVVANPRLILYELDQKKRNHAPARKIGEPNNANMQVYGKQLLRVAVTL